MKDYSEPINKIVGRGLVDKDDAWGFCNQLFWALRKEPIEDYIRIKERADAFRSTTIAKGEDKNRSANADFQKKQEEVNNKFNILRNSKQ